MENKKIAILGLIYAYADEAMGYMDDGSDSYKLFRLREELGLEIVAEYPKRQYQDRWRFVWTMFRLGPVCTFFNNPEEATELDLGELQMIYLSHQLTVGWLKCFVNPKELKLERVLN
jgi:hypothetical protein